MRNFENDYIGSGDRAREEIKRATEKGGAYTIAKERLEYLLANDPNNSAEISKLKANLQRFDEISRQGL